MGHNLIMPAEGLEDRLKFSLWILFKNNEADSILIAIFKIPIN